MKLLTISLSSTNNSTNEIVAYAAAANGRLSAVSGFALSGQRFRHGSQRKIPPGCNQFEPSGY